jgi:glycosyltransferase involved in cell wall biosynthesis
MVDDTRPYLAIMDVFCLPSYREGMPVSLLEALAMELPCVATQIRGCREEIEDGKSGYLVAPRDPNALAEKLLHIARNPEVAKKLAQNARRRVIEHFNEEVVLAKQIHIYKELLREKQLLAEAPTDGDESPSNDRRRTTH